MPCHAGRVTETSKPAVEARVPPTLMVKIINPVFRLLLGSPLHGLMSKSLMVLHVTGRKSGRVYDVPVGRHEIDGQLLTYAGGQWRTNLRGGADVRLTIDGRERAAHAVLEEDPDRVAEVFWKMVESLGYKGAQRAALKVNVDRQPTLDEVREATLGRSLVLLTLKD